MRLPTKTSLEISYLKEERKIVLCKALSELSADYRAVLWLVFFEEFSNKEVAAVLYKSDRQIKNFLYRAKLSLRSKLEKEGFSYEELR